MLNSIINQKSRKSSSNIFHFFQRKSEKIINYLYRNITLFINLYMKKLQFKIKNF